MWHYFLNCCYNVYQNVLKSGHSHHQIDDLQLAASLNLIMIFVLPLHKLDYDQVCKISVIKNMKTNILVQNYDKYWNILYKCQMQLTVTITKPWKLEINLKF